MSILSQFFALQGKHVCFIFYKILPNFTKKENKKIARLLQEATQKDSTEEKTGDGCWGEHERLLGESSSSRATGERVRPEVQSPYVDLGLQSRSQRKDAEWLHEDQDLGTLSTEELTLLQTLSVILYAHSTMPPFH